MTREAFKSLVEEAIDAIPPRFGREVRNLAIVIEDEAPPSLRAEMEMEPDDVLLGLYQGVPLTERDSTHGNVLPDRITLYQRTIEAEAGDDMDAVVAEIGETLIHELGHYFGMTEEAIMEIEERFWRGDAFEDEPSS